MADKLLAKYPNPCTRCGEQRIIFKQWKEKVNNAWGTSEITYEETVCPDPQCQKVVEQKLQAERDKKKSIDLEREKRAIINKRNRSTPRTYKKRK